MKKIINNTAQILTFEGQQIAANSFYILEVSEFTRWAFSDSVLAAIASAEISINNGENNIEGIAAQIAFLQNKNPQEVITQLEKDDKTLGLASAEGAFVGENCTLEIEIPGTVGSVGRFVKQGYAFSDTYTWGMRLMRTALVDKAFLYAGTLYPATPTEAGIPGVEGLAWADVQPNGVELGDYCDTQVDISQKGWRLWCDDGGQGGCDIDNLAGYGNLLAGCFLVLEFSKPVGGTALYMAANIQWGIQNE